MAETEIAEAGPPADGGLPAPAGSPAAADEHAGQAEQAGQAGQASQKAASAPANPRQALLRGVGVSLLLLSVFVLGFAVYLYGLSGVQEARTQTILYTRLQAELAGVGGSFAPLGPTTPGSPVAILNIPAIGIHDMVVVEGTTPENLTAGPGHLPDTPLPGQPGVAELYGRLATFGGPFSQLGRLRPGDRITVVTGQGPSTYQVVAGAPSSKIIEDPAPNRLLLLSASSATIPSYYFAVDADLISAVHPSPGVARTVTASELPMAGDTSALGLAVAWALALALVSAGGTVAAIRWSPTIAYLVAAPVALAVLWNLYQSLASLLPNLF